MDKINKFQRKAIENVKKYYKGSLIIKQNLEPIDITEGINWSHESVNNSRTYQVYLHSLSMIQDFITAGSIKGEKEYFKEANDIIIDWYKNDNKGTQKWNEHAVSTRIKNIIDFQEANHDYKLDTEFYNQMVNEHCEFLNDEDNYKRNNHGLMMDNSLIYSSSILNDIKLREIYLEKALYRIRFAFYRDFSRKGVHLENSPEYHRLVLNLYRKIEESLARHELEPDKDIKLIVENARAFNKYMVKPNLTYPLIGDTGLITERNMEKDYRDFIDYEAGISVFNNEDKNKNINSAYLTFKAGYQSKTHKHYDDLSVTYYNFGQDILVDSGKYSYKKNDFIRNFLISTEAHNTVSIKGRSYMLGEPLLDQNKMKITRFVKDKSYKLVTGINELYDDLTISRDVILTADDILFIIDGITSKSEETIQQNFNLNKNSVIENINNLKYQITIDSDKFILESFPVQSNYIESSKKKGYYSEKFSKVEENERIVFETTTEHNIFVTALYKSDQANICDVTLNFSQLKFFNNGAERLVNL